MHPTLLELHAPWPRLSLGSYAALLACAFFVGWLVARRRAPAFGISRTNVALLCGGAALLSLVCARLLGLVVEWVRGAPVDAQLFARGGMVAYGGMLGGVLSSWLLCRLRNISFIAWADAAAPSVALGTAITRVGCFLYGCDFGTLFQGPWAVPYPAGRPAFYEHVERFALSRSSATSLPVHPVQLYEAVGALILFVCLMGRRTRDPAGMTFALWVGGYGAVRALVEVWRGDSDRGLVGPVGLSQIIALLSLGGAVVAVLRMRQRRFANGAINGADFTNPEGA